MAKFAAHSIGWGDFSTEAYCVVVSSDQIACYAEDDRRLPAGDYIFLKEEIINDPDKVEIVFQKNDVIKWWKEIRLFSRKGTSVGEAALANSEDGPVTLTFDLLHLEGVSIVFSKADLIGIHTGVYQLDGIHEKGGKRVIFTWFRD